jgi:dihydrofolate reductase
MRDLIVTENITLDGVIDAAEGWFEPGDDDEEVDLADVVDAFRVQREAADAVLFGRVTFEQMRSYWPHLTDDTTGIADYLNKVTKHVMSTSLQDPDWENTQVHRGALADEITALKAEQGADIVATGSMSLVTQLIAQGLIDEYRLFVYPVVLGRGHRLFEDATNVPNLRLEENQPFRSGIVLQRYRTA